MERMGASIDVASGVRLHYLSAGAGARTIVLLHGFPQTSHEWRKVTPTLVAAGYRFVCPDYRGAGASSRPASGYDKWTMAGDIHALVREHLNVSEPIVLVGHDVGAMVALAFAMRFRESVSHLVLIDAPLQGSKLMDDMRGDPRGWHVGFHQARDIAELLVQGRERAYLQYMIGVRIFDPSAIAPEDFDTYVRAYEAPGAMRAAFELYRAFEDDKAAIRKAVKDGGRLRTPTLCIGGATSGLGERMPKMLDELAERSQHALAPRSGHWVPEENPQFLTDTLLHFLKEP
jgi:pimeloyl-ACP methyl ester carboxylesterase